MNGLSGFLRSQTLADFEAGDIEADAVIITKASAKWLGLPFGKTF
jgi:hypothetical protein